MILWQRFISRIKVLSLILVTILSVAAVVWGYIEARDTTQFWDEANIARDEAMPVNRRLRELAGADITAAKSQTVLNLEPLQADGQTTVAPQPVVWARHQHVFAGLESWEENKRRYYQLLYYSDLDEKWLRRSLTQCQNIEACMALFGWDRFNAKLSANARPLTAPEIEIEIENYTRFAHEFNRQNAAEPHIFYVVADTEANDKFTNFDRWYERDAGEKLGRYTLYRAKLK